MLIELLSNPLPKARPRFSREDRVYDIQHREKLAQKRDLLRFGMLGDENSSYSVSLYFYCKIPASWSKKKKRQAVLGQIQHTSCDVDNLIKFLFDNMNGIIIPDDRQIKEIHAAKYYSLEPRTVIDISCI